MWLLFLLLVTANSATSQDNPNVDGESSRKVLGSSVVTSVSVIMDTGNGSKVYSDAAGKPVSKPQTASDLASPINLLNPDRYEFYTFDDSGDLIKRLMTLEEIQEIIATGDGDGFSVDDFTSNGFIPEKRVNDVVHNVQNVLKEEIKTHKHPPVKPQLDTPDVSDSWSMILPAVFGNSGEVIRPEPAVPAHITPDTIMIEPTVVTPQPSTSAVTMPQKSTTEKIKTSTNHQIILIKPIKNDLELTKENTRPIYHVNNKKTTKKPESIIQATTVKPTTQKSTTTSEQIKTNSATTAKSTTVEISSTTTTAPTSTTTTTTTPKVTTTSETTVKTRPTTLLSTQSSSSTTEKTIQDSSASSTEQILTTIVNFPDKTSAKVESVTIPEFTTTQEVQTTTANDKITTTEGVTTTEKDDLPSLLQILHSFHAQNYATEEPASTTTNEPESSTFGAGLSTFFLVNDNKNYTNAETTTESLTTTTTQDDLSTLGTEYVTKKIYPIQQPTTTEKDRESTTFESLEQYLLTSTNIYEINAQLDGKITTTNEFVDSSETTTFGRDETTAITTEKEKNANLEESTTLQATSTDASLIDTIEQLISQAVGTSEQPLEALAEANTTKMSEKIADLIKNNINKTMPEMLSQAATVASNFLDSNAITTELISETTTTVQVPTTTNDGLINIDGDDDLLNQSMEMLLSQVSSDGNEDSTTVITTTNRDKVEETTTLRSIDDESIDTTTKKRDVQATTIKVEDDSHIINITIIRNEGSNKENQSSISPKPAKSDLSLEMDYEEILKEIQELQKNASLLQLSDNVNLNQTTPIPILTTSFTTASTTTTTAMPETPSPTTTEELTTTADFTTTEFSKITSFEDTKPTVEIIINETNKNLTQPVETSSSSWTLVSTLSPHASSSSEHVETSSIVPPLIDSNASPVDLVPKPLQGFGLEDSTSQLDQDIYQFVQLCNELAFGFFKSVTTGISSARSVVVSPFAATSLLAMVFLGARGATSGEMNEILKLDDMVTFNPHLIFKNVSESVEESLENGIATSAIVRELYSDRSKGKLLNFYKDRVRQFYDGHVEEASFREIGDVIRRRTNLLVKKQTNGKVAEFLKDASVLPRPPLAGISATLFHTDCSKASTDGRDGELYFVVLPSIRQRRLIPIPATVYRANFLAGYEPSLDATAAALGTKDQTVSTIFIIPGQQGMSAPGDGLARLEKRLIESSFRKGAWSRLLRSLIPRPGLELQIPRFVHRSLINSTQSLKKMGLHELFDAHKADLKGLNGASHELHLSDVLQINEFATCGENGQLMGETHHREVYPATVERRSGRLLAMEGEDTEEPRDYQRAFHDPLHDPSYLELPLSLRPRQARLPETPRLRFDRPFLYVVRHNPSGLILHMGRFHPRLLP